MMGEKEGDASPKFRFGKYSLDLPHPPLNGCKWNPKKPKTKQRMVFGMVPFKGFPTTNVKDSRSLPMGKVWSTWTSLDYFQESEIIIWLVNFPILKDLSMSTLVNVLWPSQVEEGQKPRRLHRCFLAGVWVPAQFPCWASGGGCR